MCSVGLSDDEDQQEKTLSQVYDRLPEGHSPLDILKKKDERERVGKRIIENGREQIHWCWFTVFVLQHQICQ